MENKKNFDRKVESDETSGSARVIRSICITEGTEAEDARFVHFSFRDGVFFAAMKRAKLEGYDRTFASGLFYTDPLPADFSEGEETDEAIWMPVETKEDARYLFSEKPWEESNLIPALKKKITERIASGFEQFRKEMLP